MQTILKWIVAVALGALAVQSHAQHSDVTFDIVAGQIVIEADGHMHRAGALSGNTQKLVFEADFGDFNQGPYATDDPGYVSHEVSGVLTPGDIIGFSGVGTLQFWDGTAWTAMTLDQVTLTDALGAQSTFSSAGTFAGSSSFIGAADSMGGFHSHIDYEINPDAAVGAYLIEMQLLGFDSTGSSQIYVASESYYIAINFGLSEAAFEASITALP
ncbi:hypothetical protein [Microbulbifer discodermiae]|uniref:hypothetical protein n=1 Tax=Microbulbifer sp. 2201CG32-9 TaxID=3232309 RepID=UPI00345C4E35